MDSPRQIAFLLLGLLLTGADSIAADSAVSLPRFEGMNSCQSSSCHGGGTGSDQCIIWSNQDFHARAFAILLTARSQRMAETLHLPNALTSVQCTVCHAPLQAVQTLAPERLMPSAHPDEGVSCESCHAPSSTWLRSHTRTDYTYAQRIASGMNDLRSIYERANTCVACHETLPADVAGAGHPKLHFELDSQSVSEPPHWHDRDPWIGLHSWLAGQAVAFREETWRLSKQPGPNARWSALGWLLQEVTAEIPALPKVEPAKEGLAAGDLSRVQDQANRLAKVAADFNWTPAVAEGLLQRIASDGAASPEAAGKEAQIERAQVVAQALDRVVIQLATRKVELPGAAPRLDILFADVRDPLAFDPKKFTNDLRVFSDLVKRTR